MRAIGIHTSDRNFYRECRRKWNWLSPTRQNLSPRKRVLPLWFGTGWHFVLEDLYGYQRYSDAHEAWDDYVRATLDYYGRDDLPKEAPDALKLGHKMLTYYLESWLKTRDPLKTLVIDGEPQVEVNFKIPLPINPELLAKAGIDIVYYEGTIDRVIEDEYGSWWYQEYKSAAKLATAHFLTDPQITAYAWAGSVIYDRPLSGCVYTQWRKAVPEEPTWVAARSTFATTKSHTTTSTYYRQALMDVYGAIEKAPTKVQDYLKWLETEEQGPEDDGYVRRDWIERNEHTLQAEGAKILMEVEEMINPDLPLYPSPTRNCSNWCDFKEPCIMLDNGDDFEEALKLDFITKSEDRGKDPWRQCLKHPSTPKTVILPSPALQLSHLH